MNVLLRLEGLAIGVAALVAYHLSGSSWWLFAALILVPDVSFVAYLAGPVAGAYAYNALHSWLGPVVLILVAVLGGWQMGISVGIIWAVHIGFDRALGYGLKFPSGFRDTHLGRIGGD